VPYTINNLQEVFMAIQAKLIFRSGVLSGDIIEMRGDLLRIGRDPANDFVVDDIEVSRNHAKISCFEGVYRIEDLNSTNGTLLNGRKISTSEKLKDGDLINLGETNVFEFSLAKEVESKVEPAFPNEDNPEESVIKGFFSKRKSEPELENPLDEGEPRKEKSNLFKSLSKLPTWVVVLLIALGFIILFCIIPLFFIEITNQWCNLFSGFFNAISPGTCL
jgi:predicted component of type VI protein secretion system